MIDSDLHLITLRNGTRIILDRANTAVMFLVKSRRKLQSVAGEPGPTWQTIAHIDPVRLGADIRIVTRPHGAAKAPAAVFRGRNVTGMTPISTLQLRELGIARISWQRTR